MKKKKYQNLRLQICKEKKQECCFSFVVQHQLYYLKKLNTLKLQLDKLNSIGGLNAVVPSEGIVFKYKGNTYKFTGAFAPINQITGLMAF